MLLVGTVQSVSGNAVEVRLDGSDTNAPAVIPAGSGTTVATLQRVRIQYVDYTLVILGGL